MGFVDVISRKLSSSRSSDGTTTPDRPNGNNAGNSATMIQHVPPHVRSQNHLQQGSGYADAVKVSSGNTPTTMFGPKGNNTTATSRNITSAGNQSQPQSRGNDGSSQRTPPPAQRPANSISISTSRLAEKPPGNDGSARKTSSPAQRPANSISPPTSRLAEKPRGNDGSSQRTSSPAQRPANSVSPPTSRLAGKPPGILKVTSNNTNTSPSGNGSRTNGSPQNTDTKSQQHNLQKQPSMASSLHSSRFGHQGGGAPNGLNQQGISTNQRGRAGAPPNNPQRTVARSTRRMEDSAYHAGFRDAVAQLEQEKK